MSAHLALILAEEVDQRIQFAAAYGRTVPRADLRALHLSYGANAASDFGLRWMGSPFASIPLTVIETTSRQLAACSRAFVADLAECFERVTVLLPVLPSSLGVSLVLHHGWGVRAVSALRALDGVATSLVPVQLGRS